MLGTSEIGCGLLGVSVGLKTPDRQVDRDVDFSDLVILKEFSRNYCFFFAKRFLSTNERTYSITIRYWRCALAHMP